MRISVEAFTAVNLCMDTVSLWAACRIFTPARVRWGRIALAACVGTAYAFTRVYWRMPMLPDVLATLAVAYIMAGIAVPVSGWRRRLGACAAVTAFHLLAGGGCDAFMRLTGDSWAPVIAGGCAAVGLWKALSGVFARSSLARTVRLTCVYAGKTVHMRALIDTGNRLYDPVTGLPVIAAPPEALGALIPPGVKADDPATMPPGFRLLRAQTASGPCLFLCFHPQELTAEYEGKRRCVHALMALCASSEGALALIPPGALAQRTETPAQASS